MKAKKSSPKTSFFPPEKNVVMILEIVSLILLIPLFGNFLVQGWVWDALDFITMGILLFTTGLAIDFAARKITNPLIRFTAMVVVLFVFLAFWVEAATDGISRTLQSLT